LEVLLGLLFDCAGLKCFDVEYVEYHLEGQVLVLQFFALVDVYAVLMFVYFGVCAINEVGLQGDADRHDLLLLHNDLAHTLLNRADQVHVAVLPLLLVVGGEVRHSRGVKDALGLVLLFLVA